MTTVSDPILLSAADTVAAVRRGGLTVEAVATRHLEHIAERDPAVLAWAHIDPDLVIRQARTIDRLDRQGPLAGVMVGVKDIMDTFDHPTSFGSALYANNRPMADAAIVARLRAAGALILGKTVSTEFAYAHAGPTTNPHNADHTPGGSSSGSAAAVADLQAHIGTATQTSGSVIRPAGFCGVVGFKPTFGDWPLAGIKPCAWSLDTAGLIGRFVDDVTLVREALGGGRVAKRQDGRPRIGICRTDQWPMATPEAQQALLDAARRLQRAGAMVTDAALPRVCAGLLESQDAILLREIAQTFADEAGRHWDRLSAQLQAAIIAGRAIGRDDYHGAQAHAERSRLSVDTLFDDYDVLLAPSAPGEAPSGLAFTGDPVFNRIWTLLHTPCVNLPAAAGPLGLPLGVQLIGPRRKDEALLGWAAWAEAVLAA